MDEFLRQMMEEQVRKNAAFYKSMARHEFIYNALLITLGASACGPCIAVIIHDILYPPQFSTTTIDIRDSAQAKKPAADTTAHFNSVTKPKMR
jgi:hypothetical protein